MKIFLLSSFLFFSIRFPAQNNVVIDVQSPKPSITIDGAPCLIGNLIYSCVPKTCNTVSIYQGDSIQFCTYNQIFLNTDSNYYMQWNFNGSANFPISFRDTFPNQTPICYSPIWNDTGNFIIDIYYNGWLSAYPTSDCWSYGPSHWIINVSVMPALGVHQNNLEMNCSVFPNPGKGIFYLKVSDQGNVEEIFVTNLFGEKILELKNRNESVIDLTNYSDGIYFLNIKTKNGIVVKKIVKE